jgi:hypothetical protein
VPQVLKRGGVFVGIMPSMDSLIYHGLIIYDREYEKRKSRQRARIATGKILASRNHDLVYGFFNSEGKQKHYYGFELSYRFRKAGFRKIRIGRLTYPWDTIEYDSTAMKFSDSKVYDELWDWTVYAEK